eukprot:Lankesteria_metandrocarpae@DN3673_c0_g2_i3.p2
MKSGLILTFPLAVVLAYRTPETEKQLSPASFQVKPYAAPQPWEEPTTLRAQTGFTATSEPVSVPSKVLIPIGTTTVHAGGERPPHADGGEKELASAEKDAIHAQEEVVSTEGKTISLRLF